MELVGDDFCVDVIFFKVDSLMDSCSFVVVYNLKLVKKLLNDVNDMFVIFSCVFEFYLIKVEVLYCLGVFIFEVYVLICKLCERVGVEIIFLVNNEELEIVIFNEWMLELFFENWYEWFVMICFVGYIEKFDFICLFVLNKMLREVLEKEYEKLEV